MLRRRFWLWFALWMVATLVLPRPAAAHDPFELTTTGRLSSTQLTFVTTLTRGAALRLVEPNGRPGAAFPPEDLPRLAPRLELAARSLWTLVQEGRAITPSAVKVGLGREAEVELSVTFPPPAPGKLHLRAQHALALGPGYTSALTLSQDEPPAVLGIALLTHDAADLDVEVLPPPGATTKARPVAPPREAGFGFGAMLRLGVEHILGGYDHLLFLLALLVTARGHRSALAIVTAFTLSHSLTLALAALDYVVLPSRVVEPLIALSIVLVGLENLLRREPPKARVAVCFGFGLVHGLGFAGALRDTGLGQGGAPIALPLLGFNLGVEAGQLAVVAVLLPVFAWLRKKPAVARIVLPLLSLLVVVAGAYWLFDRVFG